MEGELAAAIPGKTRARGLGAHGGQPNRRHHLQAGRVHVDLWVASQQDRGAEAASVRRRLFDLIGAPIPLTLT